MTIILPTDDEVWPFAIDPVHQNSTTMYMPDDDAVHYQNFIGSFRKVQDVFPIIPAISYQDKVIVRGASDTAGVQGNISRVDFN